MGERPMYGKGFAILLVAVFFTPAVALGQSAVDWPANARDHRFHVAGQAHLDGVWLWPWYESLSEIHSTYRSVLERMQEHPELTFTAASSQFYVWIEENDPEMLQENRRRVKEGRWSLAGGWWMEADATMADIRSSLGSRRFAAPCRWRIHQCHRDEEGQSNGRSYARYG
jgi:hypothetical protein